MLDSDVVYTCKYHSIGVKVNATCKALLNVVVTLRFAITVIYWSLQVHFNFDYDSDRFQTHTESSVKYFVSLVQF